MLTRYFPLGLFILLLLVVSCSDPVTKEPQEETTYLLTGADLSYTNEMEDCGVIYFEGDHPIDPYDYFAEQGMGMVRLRLWHTPTWYDTLNHGQRYSDLEDVKKSMRRSKKAGMQVLLNFHLSDNWADPQQQEIPAAWKAVEHNTEMLADSLYNYVYRVLDELYREGLVPDMVQVGNETNIEILKHISETTQATPIDWERNAFLFKKGMKAVRDFSAARHQKQLKIALHLASPSELKELIHGFVTYGVLDFDVIGLSYYWAWHHPTTIQETGAIIRQAKALHPDKELMIFETGYVWTDQFNDQAPNIITMTHPDFEPASPENQLKWLNDLSIVVAENGGTAVLYWEPTWVSSPCHTQWGQGSHQEHATFFDFDNRAMENGGIAWVGRSYPIQKHSAAFDLLQKDSKTLNVTWLDAASKNRPQKIHFFDEMGRRTAHDKAWTSTEDGWTVDIQDLLPGRYFAVLTGDDFFAASKSLVLSK